MSDLLPTDLHDSTPLCKASHVTHSHQTRMSDLLVTESHDLGLSGRNLASIKDEYRKRGASPQLLNLFDGLNEPGDSGNSTEMPSWLELPLFHKGRQLYKKWLVWLYISNLLSLVIIYNIPRSLRVLIFTQNSETPMKSFKRYLSTIKHLMAWETGNIWDSDDKAYHDLQSIRTVHSSVSTKVNSDKHYNKVNEIVVANNDNTGSTCPISNIICKDLQQEHCNFISLENEDNPVVYISQFDMVLTQWAFMGLIVNHPKELGCHYGTDEEFEALIHFWRGIGYLLGIDDKYNFCNGNLQQVRSLCQELEQLVFVPHLSAVDHNYEVMAKAVVDGIKIMVPGPSFHSWFRYVADILGIKVPIFTKQMTLGQTIQYWVARFCLNIVALIPGVDYFISTNLRFGLKALIRKFEK